MLRKRNVINIFQILELGVMLNFYAFEKYLPSARSTHEPVLFLVSPLLS